MRDLYCILHTNHRLDGRDSLRHERKTEVGVPAGESTLKLVFGPPGGAPPKRIQLLLELKIAFVSELLHVYQSL